MQYFALISSKGSVCVFEIEEIIKNEFLNINNKRVKN